MGKSRGNKRSAEAAGKNLRMERVNETIVGKLEKKGDHGKGLQKRLEERSGGSSRPKITTVKKKNKQWGDPTPMKRDALPKRKVA